MKLIIELDNGERFEPSEIDWAIVYDDGSAKLLFKQPFHVVGDIAQTLLQAHERDALQQSAVDFGAFLKHLQVSV